MPVEKVRFQVVKHLNDEGFILTAYLSKKFMLNEKCAS